MSEKYTFHKIYKSEEYIGSIVRDIVYDQVLEWFNVGEVSELTDEQMAEGENYRHNVLNEYSPMQWGYSDLYSDWENAKWEQEENA